MKLFDYFYCYDYGHEWYLNIFCTRLFNLFQFNMDWSEWWGRPMLLINVFGSSLFGFTLSVYKLTLSVDFLAYHQRDLNDYRMYDR
jgi:hypothetical protein